MPTHIALLRGINLAGHNKIAMADLRQVVASLGHADVATYIQSGNVVFSAGEADTTALADAQRRAEQKQPGSRDTARVIGRTIFLHTPDGFGRSELAAQIVQGSRGKSADLAGTARNWATVTRLLAMCDA